MAKKSFIWTKVVVSQLNDFLHIKKGYTVAACFNYDGDYRVHDAVLLEGDVEAKECFCGWCIAKEIDQYTVEPVTERVDSLTELAKQEYGDAEDAH